MSPAGGAAPERCPPCRRPVAPDAEHRPFCGDRCRLADLGRWFREDYVVSRPLRPDDRPDPSADEAE
jgi:endogenous inhibitor of DNA gyrase (YacG/DUF329 family)